MINKIKHFSGNFFSLSVLVLIASFFVLGSCSLKKAIQVLHNGSVQTEHAGSGHDKSLTSVMCVGGESSSSKMMSLPERQAEANAPLLSDLLFTALWAMWSSAKSDPQIHSFREPGSLTLYSVPLYLRNRTLLI